MGLRQNLSPNPACAVDATGWSSVPTGYARSTSVDPGLARSTGFEGTGAADVLTPRAAVTAGQSYVWSVQIHALADIAGANMLVNYYAALSGGAFIGSSGATVPLNLSSGQIARVEIGPYVVPAGAVSGYLKLNDLNAGVEATAHMVEQTTELGHSYFDGATAGASWDSAVGASTSTIRIFTDTGVGTGTFSTAATAAGPVSTDQGHGADTFTLASTGFMVDTGRAIDGFLIASLEFDEGRGRNRIEAFTFDAAVVSMRVSSRTVAGGRYSVVRGGLVPVSGGFAARAVDDYEYVAGVDTEYLIEGVDDAGATVQQATVRRDGQADRAWIKFVSAPALNRPLTLTDWSQIGRTARTSLYQVQGRPDPVAVSDAHTSRRLTIEVKCEDVAETLALDDALSRGYPCYLQVPATLPLPSLYASIGDYSWKRPARRSERAIFTISLTEVAAPAATIAGSFVTWQTVLDTFATWQEVLDNVPTWRDLAAGAWGDLTPAGV